MKATITLLDSEVRELLAAHATLRTGLKLATTGWRIVIYDDHGPAIMFDVEEPRAADPTPTP